MIRRRDNPTIVITQMAHSWLAGQFATYWGNQAFHFPALPQVMILAAINHDQGWAEWEQSPKLNDEGYTIDFMEMPVETHLQIWEQSIKGIMTQNYYAALVVSLHARFLIETRLATQTDTKDDRQILHTFSIDQQKWQTKTIARLQNIPYFFEGCQRHNLEANVRLLQVFDWLSLLLGMSPLTETVIVDVPGKSPNERVDLRLRPTGENSFTIIPWPFNIPSFEVILEARYLNSATFVNEQSFQEAWYAALPEPIVFNVAE